MAGSDRTRTRPAPLRDIEQPRKVYLAIFQIVRPRICIYLRVGLGLTGQSFAIFSLLLAGSTLRRSSRERKERADDESLHSQLQRTSEMVTLDSTKRGFTSDPSNRPATVDEVSSNLENLPSSAAQVARTISKLLGGEGWKSQSIGKLGPIQTRGHSQLAGLVRLVKTSLETPQLPKSDRNGVFNSDLIEGLTRAYHQRTSGCLGKSGDKYFWNLGLSDYERANELLKGKIEGNGE